MRLLVVAVLVVMLCASGVFLWQASGDDVPVDRAGENTGNSTPRPDPDPTPDKSSYRVDTTEEPRPKVDDRCAGLKDRTWVALGRDPGNVPEIAVHDGPDGRVVDTIENPWKGATDGSGPTSPPAFVVEGQDDPRDDEWLHVDLPTAPTGSLGYIRSADVTVECIAYRITVNRQDFTLTLTNQGEPVFEPFPVGLGSDQRATNPGTYFVTELLIDPRSNSPYGTGAYGIDGYSDNPDIVADFPNTGGQVGIHGTNQPDLLPGNVSNGCIRVRNEHIEQMKPVVPLGTPVDVV